MKQISRKHLHERKVMNCGLEAEIIGFDKKLVIVKINGITKRATYHDFNKGIITDKTHPNKVKSTKDYLHKTKLMNCGEVCEVIEANSWNDITVRFESGLVKHSNMWHFKTGNIANYNKQPLDMNKVYENKYGLKYRILNKTNRVNVYKVEFEDGKQAEINYVHIKNARHPSFDRKGNINNFHGYSGTCIKINDTYWWNVKDLGLITLEDALCEQS